METGRNHMNDTSKPSDGELLAVFAGTNDEAAFAELIGRHGAMVQGVCLRVLGNFHEAQDVTQAVFVTLARKAASLRKDPSVGGWLHHVAICLARNVRAANHSRQRREEQAMHEIEVTAEPCVVDSHALRAELDDAIGRLPERYRLPLVLFHLEERSLEQTAQALALNIKTASTRLVRGREMLRKKLIRRGVTAGAIGALTTLLSAEAGAAVLPATFISATVQAASLAATGKLAAGVGTGVVSAKVASLAKGAMNMLIWNSVKTAAVTVAATLVVAGGGALVAQEVAAQRGAADQPTTQTHAVTVAKPAARRPGPDAVVIVPHFPEAGAVFNELASKGGPRVAVVNGRGWRDPGLVPAELRYVPVDARKLIEAVAASSGLKVAWLRNNQWAVLHEGVAESEVLAMGEDADAVSDADLFDLFSRSKWVGERNKQKINEGWRPLDSLRAAIAFNARGEKALPFLENKLADQDPVVRSYATRALGLVGGEGERVLALIEKALADPDGGVRFWVPSALSGLSHGDKALPLFEKALADKDTNVRGGATRVLASVCGEHALALLEKTAVDHPDPDVRGGALTQLGRVGRDDDPKVMTIIKKALDAGKNDCAAIGALANMGGDKALALLEKELDSKKWNRKLAAIKALDFIGSDKALAILGAYRQRVGSGDNKGDNRLDREVLGMFDVDRQRELHDVRAEKSK